MSPPDELLEEEPLEFPELLLLVDDDPEELEPALPELLPPDDAPEPEPSEGGELEHPIRAVSSKPAEKAR
jgi:hypothetical protein